MRALVAALAVAAHAHTFHASITQIDYRSARKTLEIMVFLHAEDIERVMKAELGANASLDNARQAERFVQSYLKRTFDLRAAGQPVATKWVGLEVRTHFAVAFLEAPAANLPSMTLANRVLLDEIPDQSNGVKIKEDGADRADLVFDNTRRQAQPIWSLKPR